VGAQGVDGALNQPSGQSCTPRLLDLGEILQPTDGQRNRAVASARTDDFVLDSFAQIALVGQAGIAVAEESRGPPRAPWRPMMSPSEAPPRDLWSRSCEFPTR
jgi:hypothetical protein